MVLKFSIDDIGGNGGPPVSSSRVVLGGRKSRCRE
jgi:hypothetical protein